MQPIVILSGGRHAGNLDFWRSRKPCFSIIYESKPRFFSRKTRFSGGGVPPRRAAACTSGECGSDATCARSRENGAPNRPIWLQLLLLRAYGTTRPTILARFVAAAAAFAPPPPENTASAVPGGGGNTRIFPCFDPFCPCPVHKR